MFQQLIVGGIATELRRELLFHEGDKRRAEKGSAFGSQLLEAPDLFKMLGPPHLLQQTAAPAGRHPTVVARFHVQEDSRAI